MMPDNIYGIVRREEGGLADLPGDTGGLTNYGVTQARYDRFRGAGRTRSVRDIEESEVFAVYEEYWQEAKCDLLAWPINLVHFAFAFNAGVTVATKLLQRALNVIPDGQIWPTRAAIGLANSSKSSAYIAAYRLLLEQVFFYDSLDVNRPERTRFLTILWLKRLKHIYGDIDKEDTKEPTA